MTLESVLQDFVDAIDLLAMRCCTDVFEAANILNPIAHDARKILNELNSKDGIKTA